MNGMIRSAIESCIQPLSKVRCAMRAPMLLFLVAVGCAPTAQQQPPSPAARSAVLRILDITPPVGARVDSSSVLVARLAYHIPEFDPDRKYVITALFAQNNGGLSSRGSEDMVVSAPYGLVTIRRPLASSRGMPGVEPAEPLTGVFFLLRQDSVPSAQDTIRLGNQMRVRTAMSRSSVQARSRTFYYNGAGPSRLLSADLVGILEEYWTFRPHRALAVAYESDQRWTYGYAYGFGTSEAAVERALEECKASAARRQITTACQIITSDGQGGD